MAGLIGVGYEGLTLDVFLHRLRDRGVTQVVDVRLRPISRKPGFSKTALSRALAETGIGYRHRPAVGNPKENRAGFSGGPSELAHARARFARWIEQPQAVAAIDETAVLARESMVAVMCFEAGQSRCHRDVVLSAVQAIL